MGQQTQRHARAHTHTQTPSTQHQQQTQAKTQQSSTAQQHVPPINSKTHRTQIHPQTHTQTHKRTQTQKHTNKQTNKHMIARKRARTHTRMHKNTTQPQTHAHAHAHAHALAHTYAHAHAHALAHPHAHAPEWASASPSILARWRAVRLCAKPRSLPFGALAVLVCRLHNQTLVSFEGKPERGLANNDGLKHGILRSCPVAQVMYDPGMGIQYQATTTFSAAGSGGKP